MAESACNPDLAALDLARQLCLISGAKDALLFGSRARGDHLPESDVDIMLIDPVLPVTEVTAKSMLNQVIPSAFGADILLMEEKQLAHRRMKVNDLVWTAWKGGILAMSGENLEYRGEWDYEEEQVNWEDVDGRLENALQEVRSLEAIDSMGIHENFADQTIGRSAQFALENAYKAALASEGLEYPQRGERGHSLSYLAQEVRRAWGLIPDEELPGQRLTFLSARAGRGSCDTSNPPLDKIDVVRGTLDAVARITGRIQAKRDEEPSQ